MDRLNIAGFLIVLLACGRDTSESPIRREPPQIEMVSIPAGPVRATDVACARKAERVEDAQHELAAFRIDKTPIDCLQYAACVQTGACPRLWIYGKCYFSLPEFPHVHLLLAQRDLAEAFCRWRGMQLPTPLQWQRAIRGAEGIELPPGETDILNLECNKPFPLPWGGLGCEYSGPEGVIYRINSSRELFRTMSCSDKSGQFELYPSSYLAPMLDEIFVLTAASEQPQAFRCVAETLETFPRTRDPHE